MTDLRPRQVAWLGAIRSALRGGAGAVLGQAPTGFGKNTVAAVALAASACGAYVCHREEINLDFVERLRAAGARSVRVVMGTHSEGPTDAHVAVLSIQSAEARELVLPAELKVLWIDEAHRAAARSYRSLRARHPEAKLVGATATPARADGRPLDMFDVLVPGPQVGELVDAGELAPLLVYAPDECTDDLSADPVEVYPADMPGIVFASSLDHSKLLAERLRVERGLRAQHVEADTPGRAGIVGAFNAGELDVLCCYRLLSEGVDVPRASACVIAGKMTSAVTFLQAVGRVRRPTGGRSMLWDLCGSFWIHGHPDADRVYSLEGRAGISAVDKKAGWPSCTQCPGCLGWGPASLVCEVCGHTRPPPKPPRVSKRELRERWLDAQPRSGPEWDAFAALVQTQRQRGYKPAWATIQFKQQFGKWPRWGIRQVPETEVTT